ncbi:hypoxanthine-guanine phosphoribosyltransferase [Kangiella japonica]|uniref:Hypoxanthine-guanine phosphoribosyltransferase n=2 Tax=Kangiella japonica TaxID=647384 RepID=A0ABP3CCT3_9GAMM
MTLDDIKQQTDLLIGESHIDQAIQALAQRLNQFYSNEKFAGKSITAYCVMNGGLYFTGQLMRNLTFPLSLKYLHASRYGDETQGAELNWRVRPSPAELQGKDILLIDDIFDEGLTLEAIYQECTEHKPNSINSVVLVDKQHLRKPKSGFTPNFIGLEVEDRYIFGCGMDYKGLWRNLPAIYAFKR